ncbi:hypothetical secreted protein [Pseudomonas knackmussii B13]|uniref:Hypothetical secreted protein n=1 Tax=Pseudomonas knackmussii (strain DSM 6978 / CCUG 54928 / LMG 23759 / B13) TaxID=1301098 RepID=A0A024HNY4_PSEKB|nr:hypothetical protein [Pseudomonas knackmussii]CDF86374.1 hypothetical secreted protein [Pseudomonas knackmussii B13]
MFKLLLLANVLLASVFVCALSWTVIVWSPPLSKPVRVEHAFRVPAPAPLHQPAHPFWFAQVML